MQPPSKLAILAGGGSLPAEVAEACRRKGIAVFLVDLAGFAGEWAREHSAMQIGLGQVGRLLETLKAEGCDAVTMAGTLARPQLSKVRFDWQGVKLLPRVAKLFRQGDDALLRGIAAIFEEHGFRVIGPDAFLDDALAPEGRIAGPEPDDLAQGEIALGRRILDALSPYDVGQAAVVEEGRCLAVEAVEGTEQMLARVSAIRTGPGQTRGGVLVKIPKAGQERRVDLPTIGPRTVESANNAGLSGIAVEAQGVFILDRAETIRQCDETGLFLIGLPPAQP